MKKWLIVVLPLVVIASTAVLSTAGVKNFLAVLNGAQEVPAPTGSAATGLAHLSFDTATKNLCFEITHTVAGEVAAHIHGPSLPPGNGGVAAGIITSVLLPPGPSKTGCVLAPGAPFVKSDLFKGLYYINIHSGAFPAGEIRGQILRTK